ncbi:MAG: transposase [Clostridiales bacterium]|jgi:predicted transcriptional regulator|nr:transposase [Clostridiales bacterium]
MNQIAPDKALKELTIILMYLSRFNESNRFESNIDMAWKGYDFNIINELDDEGYIRQGSYRSKSVGITEEGVKLARNLLNKYNIKDRE